MADKKKPQPKPLGQPLDWTPAELDDLSKISPADVKAAVALWDETAPAPLKTLLDSLVEEDANNSSPTK